MASTLTVKDAILFTTSYIKQQRFNINNQQPGLGAAQIILQRLLGPPCIWRFNRRSLNFAISQGGGTDYVQTVTDLGRIETQWLVDSNPGPTAGTIHQLTGAVALPRVSGVKRPTKVAPQYDDNAGNITFRFNSVPSGNFTAYFDYQAKAPLLDSYARTFTPVPDEFAFIFFQMFLAWGSALVNDARFPIFVRQGISSLLGAQGGLDEQSKQIFVGEWMDFFATVSKSNLRAQDDFNATTQA